MKQVRTEYWAAVPKEKIGEEIMRKVMAQKEYLEKSGDLKLLRKAYKEFYGNPYIENIDQSLLAININHFANLVRHIHVMVTSQRPAWEPRAVNTDSESESDTQLASGLLDYYMREKGLEPKLIEAVLKALFLKEGWISCTWDVQGGEIYGQDPDSGFPVREGDIVYKVHTLPDITRCTSKKDMDHDWYIIREYGNKYDIAARHAKGNPELYQKIISLTDDQKLNAQYEINTKKVYDEDGDSDQIPFYTLQHGKTPAMPQGRLSIVACDDIVLFDGPLPTKRPYVFAITSSQHYETAFGHSNAHDILPLSDAFNATISAILTNQSANAVQNFQVPKGAAPNVTKFDGMNVWEYDPKAGKLEPMNLLNTAPEVFNFLGVLGDQFNLISGVSKINQGDAPATMSGTAMALLQQQAIQFSSGVQLSYALLLESVGTATIELLQTFAVVPRIAMIAGKSKRSMMKKFKGADLKGIARVIVDSANPLTKTSAGRVEIANQLLQQGLIKQPHQYISVLTTGNLEPIYEHEMSQNNLTRSENEWLMEGKEVLAVMTDDDALHVLEHSVVLNSPEARQNPKVTQAVFAHNQMHIDQAKAKDPVLAAMLKQQSFATPPQGPPPMPGAPDGMPQIMDNQNPITQQAEQTKLPQPAQPPQI